MAKGAKPIEKDDIQFIKMETTNLPTYKINKPLGIVEWGKITIFLLNFYP